MIPTPDRLLRIPSPITNTAATVGPLLRLTPTIIPFLRATRRDFNLLI